MKPSIILTLLLFSACTIYSQNIDFPKSYISEKAAYQKKSTFGESANTANYNILYHRIFWIINPAQRYIEGNVTSYFKAKNNAVSIVEFDLSSDLTVDSINSNHNTLVFTHSNDIISITLNSILDKNDIDSLTIYYKGVPPTSGSGSFETETHDDIPIMWTLSEPYGAMEWWPCKQSVIDKIDSLDIYVETLPDYKVASNGKLISEKTENGTKLTHWKHRHPIASYLVAIAVTNYEAYSHYAKVSETDSVEILNYVYPESRNRAESLTEYTVDVMEFLSEKFISYPFYDEKYGHAQFGWGGGMEHQTMSFMGGFSEGLIAHELAHQWFGNYVTCSSWEDIWVNEGFAVFCEGLIIEHLHPSQFLWWKKQEQGGVINNRKSGSVWVEDTNNINRLFDGYLTYAKGGQLLHMLRHQIDEDAFFRGINEMLTNEKTSNGFASAMDIKGYFEEAADTNLNWFFDNWYYGEGYPIYSLNIENRNSESVTFTISQATSHNSVEFFPMHVPVRIYSDEKQLNLIVHHTENNQSFTVKTGFETKSISLDPDYTILTPHPVNINYSSTEFELAENNITISPNLVDESFTISTSHPEFITKVEIIDLTGKLITAQNNLNNPDININYLNSGQYFIRVSTQNSVIVRSIIKK